MAASYKKLFKLLIDREMKSKDLAAKAGISTATLAKMKKDGATVSSDVLVKICTSLPQPMAKAVPCSLRCACKDMYVLAATDGKSCALLVANLTGATQELRIEGVDLAAARYHVIDQERLLSWSAAADKIENNQVLLIEAPVNL